MMAIINLGSNCVDLSGFWKYKADPTSHGEQQGWLTSGTDGWDSIYVPACWNEQKPQLAQYFGTIWYERDLFVPLDWSEKVMRIFFEGVLIKATVYVNGRLAGEHNGGFSEFNVRVDALFNYGTHNSIVVKVDNSLSMATCPQADENGELMIHWFNWGGIYRDVWLDVSPQCYVDRPWIYTTHQGGEYVLNVAGDAVNMTDQRCAGEIEVALLVNAKKICNQKINVPLEPGKNSYAVSMPVSSPHLWFPDDPFLYDCSILLKTEEYESQYSEPFGLRIVEFRNDSIYINGTAQHIRGACIAEDLAGAGRSVPGYALVRDMETLKSIGVNCSRHAAYPPSRHEVALGDRLGFMFFVCFPSRKFSSPSGWGSDAGLFENKGVLQEGIEWVQDTTKALRNHASVLAWFNGSELPYQFKSARDFLVEIYKAVKELDPYRPLGTLTNIVIMNEADKNCTDQELADWASNYLDFVGYWVDAVAGLHDTEESNREAIKILDASIERFLSLAGRKPFYLEFGAEAIIPGQHSLVREPGSEEHQVDYITWMSKYILNKRNWMALMYWAAFDYKLGNKPMMTTPGVYCTGIFSRERQPKLAAEALKQLYKVK